MLDKDKMFIFFYIPVGQIPEENVPDYLYDVVEPISKRFDESVIPFFCPIYESERMDAKIINVPVELQDELKALIESSKNLETAEVLEKISKLLNGKMGTDA